MVVLISSVSEVRVGRVVIAANVWRTQARRGWVVRQSRLESGFTSSGSADMTDHNSEFTDSDVWKTDATSGSRITATVLPFIRAAKRFGRASR